MDFISAEEARGIAYDAQRTIEQQTIDELARTIHATAQAGKISMTFDKDIPPLTLKNLRTLGYKIDLDYDYFHKMFYRISWEEHKQ